MPFDQRGFLVAETNAHFSKMSCCWKRQPNENITTSPSAAQQDPYALPGPSALSHKYGGATVSDVELGGQWVSGDMGFVGPSEPLSLSASALAMGTAQTVPRISAALLEPYGVAPTHEARRIMSGWGADKVYQGCAAPVLGPCPTHKQVLISMLATLDEKKNEKAEKSE